MESSEVNLGGIAQIPEHEFKEHFREWMEQDDVARCLQAKLRKDLILNFNKTTLGKKLIAQTGASHRLKLSPLILALNTLVAEFLYAQNCHFTLSVFCTEVPYRNTLPDFESVRHFRFSEPELLEIFDALCSNWLCNTKVAICRQYIKDKSSSLLFVVLQCLLHSPVEKSAEVSEPSDPAGKNKQHKHDTKFCQDYHHFRYLNKFLIVLLKKVKEMSINMALLQSQKVGTQSEHKSMNMRKLDSLHRSMHKISENLRQMSVTKRKSRSITAVVSAINAMGKQFEKCAVCFHQASKQMIAPNNVSLPEVNPVEKSYEDWIQEMRTTPNGKKFLEKVEHSLQKALLREREKLEEEFQKRLQIQKTIIKAKYKQRLSEVIAKFTARENASSTELTADALEKRLKEFELKTKEIHEAAYTSGIKPKTKSQADFQNVVRFILCNKETQTPAPPKPRFSRAQSPIELMPGKTVDKSFEPEGQHQVNNIVLDARQRVQQLEQESNLLERNIRQYLEKQKSDKKNTNESASTILNNYAIEKSILEKKCAAYRSALLPESKVSNVNIAAIVDGMFPKYSTAVLNVDPSLDGPIVPPTFKSAFRAAHKQIMAKNKAQQHQKAQLIERDKDDDSSDSSSPCRAATKVTVVTSPMSRSQIKEMISNGIESGPIVIKTSSLETGETSCSINSAGKYKPGRQILETKEDDIPSGSNGHMDSDHYEEAEEAVKMINKENGDGDAKKSERDVKKDVGVNTSLTPRRVVKKGEKRRSRLRRSKTPRDKIAVASPTGLRSGESSTRSFRYFDVNTGELMSPDRSNK